MQCTRTLLCLLLALAASAETLRARCEIAVYGDPAGLSNYVDPGFGVPFSVYVLMFTEDTVATASYAMEIEGLGTDIFVLDRIAGPGGSGEIADEETGTNVTLGECASGYERSPVLIEEYVLFAFDHWCGTVGVAANLSQGTTPVYVNCTGDVVPCAVGIPLAYCRGLPVTSSSLGAIKSMYRR